MTAPPNQFDADESTRREWAMARARVLSAGLRLVLFEIDEIGICLKCGSISPDDAVADLFALEQLPVHLSVTFYKQRLEVNHDGVA